MQKFHFQVPGFSKIAKIFNFQFPGISETAFPVSRIFALFLCVFCIIFPSYYAFSMAAVPPVLINMAGLAAVIGVNRLEPIEHYISLFGVSHSAKSLLNLQYV